MFLRRWTTSAIYCYERGCRCKGCYYYERLETPCRMKSTVLELVRIFGKPERRLNKNGREKMATRIEKKYKADSLKLVNDIVNCVSDYLRVKKKITVSEKLLADKITQKIDYFIMKHEITDEEIRRAVMKW